MKLAVGPILTYWRRERLDAFYAMVASAPIDTVYLGEVVCSRRHEYRQADWLAAAERLADAGKEVVLSAQALMESESDLKALRRYADNGRFLVEANDMGAVHVLAGASPFVAGPHLNIYNAPTLALLASLGAVRWAPPVEVSRATIEAILAERPAGIEVEAFAYGRLPLAFSARCFTARHFDLPKDDCQFRCLDHPDGLPLATRDGDDFLVLNGIQTQSYRVTNLVEALPELRRLGVDALRLSPQHEHMDEVIAAFRAAIDDAEEPAAAAKNLAALMPAPACDGYWHGEAGIAHVAAVESPADARR